MRKVVIDIGCGERKKKGAIGVDIARLGSVDIVADLTHGLPFRDSSVDAVHARHVLEHFDDLVGVMKEVYRVCRPGGLFYVTVPHSASHFMTWRDPTHRRGMNLSTLTYFDRTSFDGRLFGYYSGVDFRPVYRRLRFVAGGNEGRYSPIRNVLGAVFTDMLEAVANHTPYLQQVCERWWGHWLGIAEAYAILEAVKPPREVERPS